jgi:hypothetical protein
LQKASQDGIKRHSIQMLLPIIGATELDDWPGGARQMMEAASPLVMDILKLQPVSKKSEEENDGQRQTTSMNILESVIDQADGVRALFAQANDAKDDCCSILLPSGDTVMKLKEIDAQVGEKRNMILVNSQWRRKTDFGMAFFGGREEKIHFVEQFVPTFHCSNSMIEGEIVRILRTYPGPWRVFLRVVKENGDVDWINIGEKPILDKKTAEWEQSLINTGGDSDGGRIFDYGIPTYKEIENMISSREGYVPKSLSERAAAALVFIKDTL